MKNVIIHVGHGKTGSSFLQSVFAMNYQKMKEVGICYPEHTSNKIAIEGKITNGNGIFLGRMDLIYHTNGHFFRRVLFRKLVDNEKRLLRYRKVLIWRS